MHMSFLNNQYHFITIDSVLKNKGVTISRKNNFKKPMQVWLEMCNVTGVRINRPLQMD